LGAKALDKLGAFSTNTNKQISAALIRHRQLIEQPAKPGDLRVFVDSDQLTREVENAVVKRPKVPLRALCRKDPALNP
jgi:hypothetical protein